MKNTVVKGIYSIKNMLLFISILAVFFSRLALAEDEFIFEDEPSTVVEVDQVSDISNSALFKFGLPDNTHLLLLFIAFFVAIILGIIIYRAMLKSQIAKGVHPRVFFATITFAVLGFFLLTMLFILSNTEDTISLGWFSIFAGLYLVFLSGFMLLGRLRGWVLFVVLLLIVISSFQLASLNIL